MKPTPRLASSGVIERDAWNNKLAPTLDANFREVTIQPGRGYNIIRSPGGFSLDITPAKGGSAAAAALRPLQILLTSEPTPASGETPAVTTTYLSLYPGTVGGVFPKVDDHFLWEMPSDGGTEFLERPRVEITLPATGSVLNVWLKVHCLAGSVVGAICETGETVPANDVEYAYVQLGYVNPAGAATQTTYGNMNYLLAYALFGDGDSSNPFSHNFTPAP